MQKYETLVEEDLNVGTGRIWIHAPGGGELRSTQVGIHTVARGQMKYTKTWAPGAITAGSKASTTVTVPDATVGDFVMVSHDGMAGQPLRLLGHVSAADTVTAVMHNPTAAAITPTSGTLAVLVFPSIGAAAPLPMASVTGTVRYNDGTLHLWVGVAVTMTVDAVPWPGGPATTDGSGVYEFLNVPDGNIDVSVSDLHGGVGPYSGSASGVTVAPAVLTLDIQADPP